MTGPIDRFTGEYAWLGNFYGARVFYDGHWYPAVEHGFHAAKTLDPEERALIRRTRGPADAKRIGRRVLLRPGWDLLRDDIMAHLLWLKFSRHTPLLRQLLATGDRQLIEGNTWGDVYWGVCDGVGENNLGRLLMRVRAELRAVGRAVEAARTS